MPQSIATLRQDRFASDRIDEAAGIIYGVKIAELGKVACFAGPKGEKRYATITKSHADAFISHAGNRSIPVHWTHDYRAEGRDNLHAKCGALKNIRLDDSGNPIADLYVSPGPYRDQIFWNANHDVENMMLSPVYGYDPDDKDSVPLSFNACDLVESGAATLALFSEHKPNNTMESKEFIALFKEALKDPEIVTLITPKAAQIDTAAMSNLVAVEVGKVVTAEMAKAEAALAVKAEAAVVAKLGSHKPLENGDKKQSADDTPEKFIEAEMSTMDKPNRGQAIAIMATKKPALYARYVEGK